MEAVAGQLGLLSHAAGAAPQTLLGLGAVATVLCLEVPYRVAGVRVADLGIKKCAKSAAVVLCRCAPEVLGFSVVLTLALVLRLRGDTEVHTDAASQQVWEQIKVEWPILMGADTLLNLQAMLRLLVLLFVAIRAEWGGKSPLTGMPALLFLAAALTRGMLSTRTEVYRLEGPLSLGGDLPIACELAGVPFLAALGYQGLKKAPVKAVLAVSGAIWFASHHYLNLAKDGAVDRLFIQAHVLEIMAAFAYVARACSLMVNTGRETSAEPTNGGGRQLVEKSQWNGNAFVGFMHMLLTLQQALSAYYFLTAFEPHPSLVGSGRPFCVLCIGNLLQLAAYLCAASVWAGASVDLNLHVPVEAIIDAVQLDDDDVSSAAAVTEMREGSTEAMELLTAPAEKECAPVVESAPKDCDGGDDSQVSTEVETDEQED